MAKRTKKFMTPDKQAPAKAKHVSKEHSSCQKNDGTRLSVCMIVRNEEKFLGNCLESVQVIADEIIIVDTGSTDRTVEIARKFTDKVYIHAWENNFSKSRNQSLAYAKGDWIMIIDADEELVSEDMPNLMKALEEKELDAIMVQVINKSQQDRGESILNSARIFRNNGVIHYEGRVHNRAVGITKSRVCPVRFFHHGYDVTQIRPQEKFDRTVALLKMDLADDPHNPITHHYLSRAYLSREMYEQALEASLTAIRLAEANNDRDLLYLWSSYTAALSCYRLNDLYGAEEISLAALKKYPKHIDSHFMLILVYFDNKRWPELIEHGNEYIRLINLLRTSPALFDNLVTSSLNDAWNIHALIGMSYFELGRPARASAAFEQAVSTAPAPFIALRAAGMYFSDKKDQTQARLYLERAQGLNAEDRTVNDLLSRISVTAGARKTEPTISCCMIVKDEEAFLEKCLDSVKDYVDEIIIVDTGSVDRTVEIARNFTNKIYFHAWENSFSKARNQALAYATGEWIFIIDADEEMLGDNGELLRQTVREAGDTDAILVNTISIYSNGDKLARHNSERLFKNNGVIHYEGIVHNLVVGHRSIKSSKIELMHYGYNLEEKKANEKFNRTTELLKKQIEEQPDNPMPHHYLGTSYLSRGFNKEAAEESSLAIDLAERQHNDHPVYLWSHHNAAIAFFRLADLEKARYYSLKALEKCPDHLDSLYTMAMIAAEKGDWTNVLGFGERYLTNRYRCEENPDDSGVIINCTLKEGAGINLAMGHAFYSLNERHRMTEHYHQAYEFADEKWKVWWNIGTFHMDRSENLALARQYLDKALAEAPEEQPAWYMLAKLNKKCMLFAEEKHCLEQIVLRKTEDLMVLDRLTTLCIETNDLKQALAVTNAALAVDPAHYPAICNLGLIYKKRQMPEEAVKAFLQAVEIHPKGIIPWIKLGEISLSLNKLAEAKTFFESALSLQNGLTDVLLQLCHVELKLNALDNFVSHCDQLLQELGLNRNRTLNNVEDIAAMLLDMNFALRHRPESAALALSILSQLPIDYHTFDSGWSGAETGTNANQEKTSFIMNQLNELCRTSKTMRGAMEC